MRTLIHGGTVVTASDEFQADVLVEGEHTVFVGDAGGMEVDRRIDARRCYVLPGGVDVHTHLDLPLDDGLRTSDDFESGTIAAACGGTTCIVDFATQRRGGTLGEALAEWRARAEGRSAIDFGFHLAIVDVREDVLTEMEAMVAAGVTSFKLYMAYPGTLMVDDAGLLAAMMRSRDLGATILVHAENGAAIDVLVRRARAAGQMGPRYHAITRPPEMEAEATARAIRLSEIARAPLYVVHVSAGEAVEAIAAARVRGLPVRAETCPQYLLLTGERYEGDGLEAAKHVVSPPLRTAADAARLWRALRAREIDVVATDHCPFFLRDKARGLADFTRIPNGAPGIEHRLGLLYDSGVGSGRLSRSRFVELTATAPARLFGMYPRKGSVAPGSDADLIVWDPERRTTLSAATHRMRVDYDVYEGRSVLGVPAVVLSRGQVIVEHGRFVGRPGRGLFVPRSRRPGGDEVWANPAAHVCIARGRT